MTRRVRVRPHVAAREDPECQFGEIVLKGVASFVGRRKRRSLACLDYRCPRGAWPCRGGCRSSPSRVVSLRPRRSRQRSVRTSLQENSPRRSVGRSASVYPEVGEGVGRHCGVIGRVLGTHQIDKDVIVWIDRRGTADAKRIDRQVPRDRERPGRHRPPSSVEHHGVAEDSDEGLLGYVLCETGIADDADRQPEQPVLVPPHEYQAGLLVADRHAREQGLVGDLVSPAQSCVVSSSPVLRSKIPEGSLPETLAPLFPPDLLSEAGTAPSARSGSAPRLSRVLEPGTAAPPFDLPDQDGALVSAGFASREVGAFVVVSEEAPPVVRSRAGS